ncbi:MAG: sugar phosphate isomerase/epimerase [Bacteroidales bacterium]|nr:sugar phosphate isomerase/epimerase [Bacteroidales bacterium]MCF8390428.1 sugar phosphate isomerase/epimerase [Bacteroidales bacterium]
MNRREFSKISALGALAFQTFPVGAVANLEILKNTDSLQIPLGIGNHSLRAMRPNAQELIDFAINNKLDSVQFNTLQPFENLDENYLTSLKKLAKSNDVSIYVGVGSISEKSVSFSDKYGDARSLVAEGIRVAKVLESPVLGVRIGVLDDRYSPGGIKPKMDEVSAIMKAFKGPISDAGVKFAFENHAGDMRSEELLELIDQTGSEICGAFYDPGNAIYAMEDPMLAMKALGEHIICSQARDVVIWPTNEGATFQWTALGEGMMDFRFYTEFLSLNCPGVPIHIETISNSPRTIPYLRDDYWKGFPDLKATDIIDFLKLVRVGHPVEVAIAPPGADKKAFEMEDQKNEFLKSIKYLREEFGVGNKK